MTTLNELVGLEKAHWELHLKAAQKDLGVTTEIRDFLSSKMDLPKLEHLSFIHWWLEKPETRIDLEKVELING